MTEPDANALCHYCGKSTRTPCRNTRDMDPVDGFNNDPGCNKALSDLGGGERGYVYAPVPSQDLKDMSAQG